MLSNDYFKALLEVIKRQTFSDIYPIPAGLNLDTRYIMACGMIAGMASEAIEAVREDRPLRIDLERRKAIEECILALRGCNSLDEDGHVIERKTAIAAVRDLLDKREER